jgi:hypothetical protein
MKVWEHGKDFKTELLADKDVLKALSAEEIEDKFDMGYHTKHVDTIFKRVFGSAIYSTANSSTALTVREGDQTGNTKLGKTLKKLFRKVKPK